MKKQLTIICIIGMLLAVGLSGCFEETKNISQIVKSRTIYVDVNGGKDYSKIQDAIDNSTDGDIIFVYSGIYKEHLIINKSIILIGEDRDSTIITCNEIFRDYSVVIVTADGVTIENFTITNSSSRMIDIGLGDVPGWITTAGIQILSNNCILRNNRFQDNDEYGIWLQNSNNNTIINNIISNNTGGIYLENSTHNVISENRIYYGNDGIILAYHSDSNIIQDNIISDCKYGAGIFFHSNSNNNAIKGNTIMNCLYWGIHFQSDIPHWLYLSENNTIYHNSFINNTYGVRDDYHNIWYNSTLNEGNYWDDYNGTDSDGDGIGDTPYNIHGEYGDNQDLYPLMNPFTIKLQVLVVSSHLVDLTNLTCEWSNESYVIDVHEGEYFGISNSSNLVSKYPYVRIWNITDGSRLFKLVQIINSTHVMVWWNESALFNISLSEENPILLSTNEQAFTPKYGNLLIDPRPSVSILVKVIN